MATYVTRGIRAPKRPDSTRTAEARERTAARRAAAERRTPRPLDLDALAAELHAETAGRAL